MSPRLALLASICALAACGGRSHAQQEGCYTLVPVRPQGIIRDECQLLADAASNLSGDIVVSGDIVALNFRFATPARGTLLDVSMAGQFSFGKQQFSADGTAANVTLPVSGQDCSLQLVDVHLDGVTDSKLDGRAFDGVIRIFTYTPRPEACVCQTWFEYRAVLSSSSCS